MLFRQKYWTYSEASASRQALQNSYQANYGSALHVVSRILVTETHIRNVRFDGMRYGGVIALLDGFCPVLSIHSSKRLSLLKTIVQ